jgi:hypothetical protein
MKMKSALVAAAMIAAFGLFIRPASGAEVNVSIDIPLPGLALPAPPGLVVVPGTYIYYPPEVNVDIFFYHGYWYRPHRGGWFIASGYNGPWRVIGRRRVPGPLLGLPPAFRRMPPRHEHVPYPVVEKNWRTWEKERRWDNARSERHDRGRGDRDRKEGRGRGHGEGRGHGKHGD